MIPSIVDQAAAGGFSAAFYDFRKAKVPDIDFFNPAIVRRDDGLWLVTRRSEVRPGLYYGFNELMAFSLDENHLPQVGHPIKIERVGSGEHFEDPRTVFHAGSWWLSICNFVIFPGNRTWTGAHQIIAEMDSGSWLTYRRHDPAYGKNSRNLFEQKGDEKNWLWFSHGASLHMVYMTVPHTIVRWDNTFDAKEEYVTRDWHPGWKHGQPRGGTAPVRIGAEYLSFFHSSTPWQDGRRRYHMGAYTFKAEPPFQVTSVTPEPILSGSQSDPWSPGKPLVVFPCAAIHENDEWTVSLGVNDLVSARATISDRLLAKRLSGELAPVEPQVPALSDIETIYA